LVGKTFGPVRRVVEEEEIRQYLGITAEGNPVYHDQRAAMGEGYARCVAPPSFAPFVALSILKVINWERDFLLDIHKGTVLSGEQELELKRPIYIGQSITVQGRVVDVSRKQGKRAFDVARIEVIGLDEEGSQVFSGAISCILME